MKTLIPFILLFFILFHSNAQKAADVRIGLGYPIISNVTTIPNVDLTVNSFPTLFIERPFPFQVGREEKISINPGLMFGYFKEKQNWGNISQGMVGENTDLNHISFSGYAKFIYKQEIARRSEAFIYFGGLTGIHLFTRTFGTVSGTSTSQTSPTYSEDISESGKDFFNSIYFGPLIGFQPDAKITNRYKISIEVAYLPSFITVGEDSAEDKANGIHVSLQIGVFN